jgi:hypothetical protein
VRNAIGVDEGSGQLRPYVRPVVRRVPLAIMGVRGRVGHRSGQRAQGTIGSTLIELETFRRFYQLPKRFYAQFGLIRV